MSVETVPTNCQKCGKPMTVQIEVNPMFSIDALASMATCDACYKNLHTLPPAPKPRPAPRPAPPPDVRKPYKD